MHARESGHNLSFLEREDGFPVILPLREDRAVTINDPFSESAAFKRTSVVIDYWQGWSLRGGPVGGRLPRAKHDHK